MVRSKEHRQRGKKRKVEKEEPNVESIEDESIFVEDRVGTKEEGVEASTSWMIDQRSEGAKADVSVPFGLVDPDLKAYLRSAHVTLQEHITAAAEEGRGLNVDEDIKALRNAMLDEIKGKELILATDTDTSLILEDLLSTFGDRQTRILAEALSNELFTLVCHRFGSHVIQTLLNALQYFAMQNKTGKKGEDGQESLRSCQQLMIDYSESLRQKADEVLSDQFASHVLRSLLLILSGQKVSVEDVRSKRSKKFYQKNQLLDAKPWSSPFEIHQSVELTNALSGMLYSIQTQINDPQRIREMCVNPTLSPTLAIIVTLSAGHNASTKKTKDTLDLLDVSLDGLLSAEPNERSPHVETLLRDTVGSHYLETVLKSAPQSAVERFWKHYLRGRVGKLGTHPTANFVVSGSIKLLDEDLMEETFSEVEEEGHLLVKARHLGPLIAMIDRAAQFSQSSQKPRSKPSTVWTSSDIEAKAVRSVLLAFGITKDFDHDESEKFTKIDILLSSQTVKEYKKSLKAAKKAKKEAKRKRKAEDKDEEKSNGDHENKKSKEITLQGSLLCQSIARLGEPGNSPILNDLLALEEIRLISIATDPSGVHLLLAAIESSKLSFASRSKLSSKLLTILIPLLSDKFGSRVMDSIFDHSDFFFREKIARACLKSERTILATTFGRFFLKRIHIALFRKDIDQWKSHLRSLKKTSNESATQNGKKDEDSIEPVLKKQKRAKIDEDLDAILAHVT